MGRGHRAESHYLGGALQVLSQKARTGAGREQPGSVPRSSGCGERGRGGGSLRWEASGLLLGRPAQPTGAPSRLSAGGWAREAVPPPGGRAARRRSSSFTRRKVLETPFPSREATQRSLLSRRLGRHRRPLLGRHRRPLPFTRPTQASRDQSLLACPALRSMQPIGLEGPSVLCRRPLVRLLLLLSLLPRRITHAQTMPGAPGAPTMLGTPSDNTTPGVFIDPTGPGTSRVLTAPGGPSTPSLRELAQALMRDFPLVDGLVDAGGWEWAVGVGEGVLSMQG